MRKQLPDTDILATLQHARDWLININSAFGSLAVSRHSPNNWAGIGAIEAAIDELTHRRDTMEFSPGAIRRLRMHAHTDQLGRAVCLYCDRDMRESSEIGCWGNSNIRMPNGSLYRSIRVKDAQCADCLALHATPHHPGCMKERCPKCAGHINGCGCLDKEPAHRVQDYTHDEKRRLVKRLNRWSDRRLESNEALHDAQVAIAERILGNPIGPDLYHWLTNAREHHSEMSRLTRIARGMKLPGPDLDIDYFIRGH